MDGLRINVGTYLHTILAIVAPGINVNQIIYQHVCTFVAFFHLSPLLFPVARNLLLERMFIKYNIAVLTPIRQMALNCSNMVPYGTMFALCSIEHGPIWDHVGLKFDLNLVQRNLTDINGVLTKSRL